MPALSTRENSSKQVGDFINTIQVDQKLYVGLGKRSTTWSGAPDQISNEPQEKTNFWDELLGIKKVAIRDVIPMVMDRRWLTGTPYVAFDETNEYAYDDSYYVINTKFEVMMVGVVGAGNSTDEPTKAQTGVSLADGYTWNYLFTVSTYEYQQTPSGWLSVNYGSSIDSTDAEQDVEAFVKLAPRYATVRIKIDDPNTSSEFSAGEFRQIALISNPRLLSGDFVINTYEPSANLKAYSGYLTYLENRAVEEIITGQNTDLKITLRF